MITWTDGRMNYVNLKLRELPAQLLLLMFVQMVLLEKWMLQ
jgi:hypothetical protein